MNAARKNCKKTSAKCSLKANKAPTMLSIVTVRISDLEKERIDEIMKTLDIKRYSDVMRMALQLVKFNQQSG